MSSSEGYVDEVPPSLDLVALLLGMHHDPNLEFEARIAAVAGWERVIGWATAMQPNSSSRSTTAQRPPSTAGTTPPPPGR